MINYTLSYLAIISLLAIYLTIRDKKAAKKGTWRVKERTLLVVSALGGSAVMLLTMLAIRHKTRHIKFMVGIPLILLAQVLFLWFAFNQSLAVSRFTVVSDKIHSQVKLIQIADLHACDYGNGQRELLNAIDAEAPDAILLCGDIFDDKIPPGKAVEVIKDVSGKYPCYYVSGNHEFWSRKADEFKATLESYGVKVLEETSEILDINGERIRISGIDDPDTDRYPSRSAPYAEQIKRLSAETYLEMFTILLSHRPERIEELLPLHPDLVLSGHAHGGQIRIPFILENGLWSPNQGFFP